MIYNFNIYIYICIYIYIIIYIYIKLETVVKGERKAPFSIATLRTPLLSLNSSTLPLIRAL